MLVEDKPPNRLRPATAAAELSCGLSSGQREIRADALQRDFAPFAPSTLVITSILPGWRTHLTLPPGAWSPGANQSVPVQGLRGAVLSTGANQPVPLHGLRARRHAAPQLCWRGDGRRHAGLAVGAAGRHEASCPCMRMLAVSLPAWLALLLACMRAFNLTDDFRVNVVRKRTTHAVRSHCTDPHRIPTGFSLSRSSAIALTAAYATYTSGQRLPRLCCQAWYASLVETVHCAVMRHPPSCMAQLSRPAPMVHGYRRPVSHARMLQRLHQRGHLGCPS